MRAWATKTGRSPANATAPNTWSGCRWLMMTWLTGRSVTAWSRARKASPSARLPPGSAAAPAPVHLAPVAGAAGLRHPRRAAEPGEAGVMPPDFGQRRGPHRREAEARQALGGVAGQREAGRGDVDDAAAPSAHARLRAR